MQTRFLAVLAAVFIASAWAPAVAIASPEPPAELKPVFAKIDAKANAGKKTEADFADELKALDALIAKHKGETNEEAALILFGKAAFYNDIVDDDAKADAVCAQIIRDFPDTKIGRLLKLKDEGKKLAATLVAGAKFPEFAGQDLAGKPVALSSCKGKVVLIEFWDTDCGPCVAEMPNVLKTYEKYHPNGFDIIGVSLDADKAKLERFVTDHKMAWPQLFDGQGFDGGLPVKFGVSAIPITYLLDGKGEIIARELRGDGLEKAVATAIAKP